MSHSILSGVPSRRNALPHLPLMVGLMVPYLLAATLPAQSQGDTRPVEALRENAVQTFFLKDARVVLRPGEVLESASISISETSVVAVGKDITPLPGAKVIDCIGKTIYPGLIDAFSEIDVEPPTDNGNQHWNGNVLARRIAAVAAESVDSIDSLRSQGVTVRLIAPRGGIVKGVSSLVMLDGESSASLLQNEVAQHLQITVPRDQRRDSYPNSPMGAVALLRQTLSDATWYTDAWSAYEANPKLSRPKPNDDLARIASDMAEGNFVVDAQNERMAIRADQLAREFSIPITLRGSGREYRELAAIAATGRMILLPVDFPEPPDVASEAAADDASLRDLMHWYWAPQNPALLDAADVDFCLTTHGLDEVNTLLKQIRVATKAGLDEDTALAALTTTPARWLGMDATLGQIRIGSLANLVVTDGELFDEDTKVLATWVAGRRFEIESPSMNSEAPLADEWNTTIKWDSASVAVVLSLDQEDEKWSGEFSLPNAARSDADKTGPAYDSDSQAPEEESSRAKLEKLARASDRLTASVDLSKISDKLPAGASLLTLVTVGQSESPRIFASLTLPDGTSQNLLLLQDMESNSTDSTKDDADTAGVEADSPENDNSETEDTRNQESHPNGLEIPINHPLGGYGVTEKIPVVPAVLFRGATVWTCSPDGVQPECDVLILAGKIESIGKSLVAPEGCLIIDAAGKHISPGLIDCHSHMGTDGGVNESGQVVTAEVRIGDFIDNSDINIYRQLAGGLTMANILHGSANPIGGQNQVVKLRWGDSMDEMKVNAAPAGIKFALGENVKRSNWGDTPTRYPASRMGVEQLFRDRFHAAEEYLQEFERWKNGNGIGLPPRRDFELDAIGQILRGERWIHCHSYRQDEIVALLDLLDKFDVTIGTLQHILEGYKVADRMQAHGAMASAFSDWWAYKFEVYDAIPDNGAIMHNAGIVVSFNSDDRELARHMNTEAAKAVKYGGLPAEEALKFVTLNPAKQLRIDDHVGSIEPGKDGDVVVWSGPPLSTLSRCEQTWVDGRQMFSLEQDAELRKRDAQWRAHLISKILDEESSGRRRKEDVDEENRWLRYDEFCHGHDDSLNHLRQRTMDHRGHTHRLKESAR